MDITTKKYNLLHLWLESFVIINKCTGKLIKTVLCLLLLIALVIAVLALGIGTSALLGKLQMTLLAQTVGFGTLLIYIASLLISNFLGIFFITVIWQIISAQALQYNQPLSETFSSSVWPTIYQFVAALLLAIPGMIILAVLAIGSRTSSILFILGGLLVFMLGVRLCYSFIAIAIDNRGPIEGIVLSWKLTSGKNYVDALLMCLMLVGSMALLEAFFLLLGYMFYTLVPLYFANSFSLAAPSLIWWFLGIVVFMVATFYYFAMLAFPVLVFLNRNAQVYGAENIENTETISIPLPELETPAGQEPNSAELQKTDDKLSEEISLDNADDPWNENNNELQTHKIGGIEIERASVNTSDEDTNEITQQLHKVYTPRSGDVVQHKKEDRMPTILFDDELAKQLQQEHTNIPTQQPPADEDSPNKGSIGLSKEE